MSNKRLIETVVFGVIEAGPNKPEKPRSEWLGNVKERRNTWIVTEPLVQRRTENFAASVGKAVDTNWLQRMDYKNG